MNSSMQRNQQMQQSISGSRNGRRSQQSQQQQNEPKAISNRQKILNLHQRIKMLDQINSPAGERNVSFNFDNTHKRRISQERDEQITEQSQPINRGDKTFLKRSLSPNPAESNIFKTKQNNIQSFFRNNTQSLAVNANVSANNNPINNLHVSSPTFLNRSLSSQHSISAPRLPSYSPSPKQFQQSQNISHSTFRPVQMSQMTEFYPLEARYLSIEDKFLQFKLSEQTLLKNIEGEIQQLQQSCKQVKKDKQKAQKRTQESIDNLQKSLTAQINELSVQQKQVKKGAIESLDSKHKAIRCQTIAMISEQFQSQCKLASTEIQVQLENSHKLLEKQQALRDQTAEFLINSFGDQIIKLEEVFNNQREARIKKNDQLLKLINKVQDDLMDALQREKREMVQTVDDMENMLEQVCYKIQQKILGN